MGTAAWLVLALAGAHPQDAGAANAVSYGPPPAPALGPCTSSHVAGSSTVITISGPVSCTLSDLVRSVPSSALKQVDPGGKVWLLRAGVELSRGAALLLHGSALGGDVEELRLKADVRQATLNAEWGTIDIRSTRVLGWQESRGRPAQGDAVERPAIRARSFLEGGEARESVLNVVDSEISNLGYDAPESYGLVWKVKGTGGSGSDSPLFGRVGVYGEVRNSNIHDNHMGIYTFGAVRMAVTGNRLHHNTLYGWDGHDNTRDTLVEENQADHNGTHGIICSQHCSGLVIRNNLAADNGGHGIMLHKDTTGCRVEANVVARNGISGVAVFASDDNQITGNLVSDNPLGIHVYVGSRGNALEQNLVQRSGQFGVLFDVGTSVASDPPTGNQVQDNAFEDNQDTGLKEEDADRQDIRGNLVNGRCQGSGSCGYNADAMAPLRARLAGAGSDGGPGDAGGPYGPRRR